MLPMDELQPRDDLWVVVGPVLLLFGSRYDLLLDGLAVNTDEERGMICVARAKTLEHLSRICPRDAWDRVGLTGRLHRQWLPVVPSYYLGPRVLARHLHLDLEIPEDYNVSFPEDQSRRLSPGNRFAEFDGTPPESDPDFPEEGEPPT